jgi:hypothetical protein
MLLPHSRSWTPLQKWLVVASTTAGLFVLALLIYRYERYERGPDDTALVGTWRFPTIADMTVYWDLRPDHTFRIFADTPEQNGFPLYKGTWFGGGAFVYFLQPVFHEDGDPISHPLEIWRLEDVSPNELRIRVGGGISRTLERVAPRSSGSSNKSLEPTAGRRITSIFMAKTHSLQAMLAVASGGSAPSR